MKTTKYSSIYEAERAIDSRVEVGNMLHGSPVLDLSELTPNKSRSLTVHTASGQQLENFMGVYGSRSRVDVVFYGTVQAVVRRAGLHRGSGIKPILRGDEVLDNEYYLSGSGKD